MSAGPALVRHSQLLKKKLKESGATSPSSAKTVIELSLSRREILTLSRLKLFGNIKEIIDAKGEKRYYLP